MLRNQVGPQVSFARELLDCENIGQKVEMRHQLVYHVLHREDLSNIRKVRS